MAFVYGKADYPEEDEYSIAENKAALALKLQKLDNLDYFTGDMIARTRLSLVAGELSIKDFTKSIPEYSPRAAETNHSRSKDEEVDEADIDDPYVPEAKNSDPDDELADPSLATIKVIRDRLNSESEERSKRGECKKYPPEVMYPEDGEGAIRAQKICRVCEVRGLCGELALLTREDMGIWGGLSGRSRSLVRKELSIPKIAPNLSRLPADDPVRMLIRRLVEDINDLELGDTRGRPKHSEQKNKVTRAQLVEDARKCIIQLFQEKGVSVG